MKSIKTRRCMESFLLILAISLSMIGSTARAEGPYPTAWIAEDPVTLNYGGAYDVSADGSGGAYIVGDAFSIGGGSDAGLARYDASGTLLWHRELSTPGYDVAIGSSADGLGNVYISGYTEGALEGTNAGGNDAFLSKYNGSGSLLWTRQLGTPGDDRASGVSADGLGNVFISGSTNGDLDGTNAGNYDAFVSKYDSSGSLAWTRQLGTTSDDWASAISADGLGNVYISGSTAGSLDGTNAGGDDAFVSKYDGLGSLLWTRQLGTFRPDWGLGVSADGFGNVFISGETSGNLAGDNAGFGDAFVSKYDPCGALLWTRQVSTDGGDTAFDVSADAWGNVFVSGTTDGFIGTPGPEDITADAFVSKYDASGSLLWTQLWGSDYWDAAYGVSTDDLGNVFVGGRTEGGLSGPNYGSFLIKMTVPEPGMMSLLALGALALRRRKRR